MASLILAIIVTALVAGFAAQVVSEDKITAPIREWIYAQGWRFGKLPPADSTLKTSEPHQVWYWKFASGVVECYRCSGVWLSLAAATLVRWAWPWDDFREFVIIAFAASFLQYAIHSFVLHVVNEPEQVTHVAVSQDFYTDASNTQRSNTQ